MEIQFNNEIAKKISRSVDAAFENRQIPWLKQLIEIPSHTPEKQDVEKAAGFIDKMTSVLNLKTFRIPDPEGRYADTRIHFPSSVREADVVPLLAGHCDTVFPRASGFLHFEREGDVIRGPGTLDMKSGLSVILFALRAIQQTYPAIYEALRFRFVCNTDEEVGSPFSGCLFNKISPFTNYALIFEGGRKEDQIITRRKGTGGFKLTVHGMEAHAGNEHDQGVNAIHAMSLLVPRIEELTDYAKGSTLNVGVIEGGTAKNTVPGRAEITFDARVSVMDEGQRIEEALHQLVASPFHHCPDIPERFSKAKVELSGSFLRYPMEATPESQRLRKAYEIFAEKMGLGIGEAPMQGGGSDANLLAAAGVPCIDGLGPWGQYFHSAREWSSLSSLKKRTAALAGFLCHVCREVE